ncbi:MAG: deaminase, partial [Saprospiraceae bacterium]
MIKQTQLTEEAIHNFMQAALLEGRKARPKCAPNPPVGCVIVKDNQIVARGHTNEPGQPHAEAMALNQLSPEIEDFTMFVTLEPCSFFGRTPSCA